MKFSLLENGVDSLKAAFNSLDNARYLDEGSDHHIKDATLSLNHANEILFKYLLKQKHDFLIFSDISAYMQAKAIMIKENKSTVFEAKPNLKTVSLHEAIRRLFLLCDIEVPENLRTSLDNLTKKRNEIMHYALEMNEEEYQTFIEDLKNCYELTIHFFSQHFDDFERLFDIARFEYSFEPDVEAMADDSYSDWLAEQDS
ncbi:hypothetical protein M3205_06270 [Cytobacillus firmus]|uniref:hypothetical protein n=1 Tax=Cytobacillus firmus TaxID=1399 RepID=UPI00203D7898|nr:hypothetical protein [Cytobacillus firmus]MCM3705333.1 hypothetical protein [Cytobacillus firmus]